MHIAQTIFQIVLTILFCYVLVAAAVALTLFLWKTGKDFFKPKPGSK